MCGRTACTLQPADMRRACSYRHKGRYRQPECYDNGQEYKPSYNFCPTDTSLVLVAGNHVKSEEPRVLVPMIWGMIPPWHHGDTWKNHGLTTNNCRLESITTSRLYSRPLKQGKRCVILCNGFYEWQTTKGKANKVPYFIYNKQPEGVNVMETGPWKWSEEEGWSGPTLLCIAGLFDTWKSTKGEELYSYTMITWEADETLSWLHHRQPAFLDTDEQVGAWLDNAHISTEDALAALQPPTALCWYRVSTLVNNCHNKDAVCCRPLDQDSPKKVGKTTLMSSWLKKGVMKRESDVDDDKTDVKKVKVGEGEDHGSKDSTEVKQEVASSP